MNNKTTHNSDIRFPTPQEFYILKELSKDNSLPYIHDRDIWLREAMESKRIFVAEIDSNICGMITWDYIFQNTIPLATWIYVIKEYRHGSLTRLLTEYLYLHLRQQGYKRLLYTMHESRNDPSSIEPHGYLEWLDKRKEKFYWMKLAE